MQKNDCKSIIFSSSATVYGNYKDKILTEDLKENPQIFMAKQNPMLKIFFLISIKIQMTHGE